MLSDRCLSMSCLSVTLVYCGQTIGWIEMPLGTERGRPRLRRHCVRWGPSSPTERDTTAPTFRRMSLCPIHWVRVKFRPTLVVKSSLTRSAWTKYSGSAMDLGLRQLQSINISRINQRLLHVTPETRVSSDAALRMRGAQLMSVTLTCDYEVET